MLGPIGNQKIRLGKIRTKDRSGSIYAATGTALDIAGPPDNKGFLMAGFSRTIHAFAALLAFVSLPASAMVVDVELALLIDVSGSITDPEFFDQRGGYEAAFRNAAVQNAIDGLPNGKIAVTMILWSAANDQFQLLPWGLVTAATANDLADVIGILPRFGVTPGATSPSGALNFAAPLFVGNGFEGTRQVIDISSDGEDNDPAPGGLAAAQLAALTIVDNINSLTITTDFPNLGAYYHDNVTGGPDSFTIEANAFGAIIQQGILDKLECDIAACIPPGAFTPVPVPPAVWLFGSALGLLGWIRHKKAS